MEQSDKDLINEKFKGVYGRMDAYQDLLSLKLEQIQTTLDATHAQAMKTNGRVTALEKETSDARWLQSKRKRYAIFVVVPILISFILLFAAQSVITLDTLKIIIKFFT